MENFQPNDTMNQTETFSQPNDPAAHAAGFQPTPAAPSAPAINAAALQPTIAESELSAAIVPAPILYDATATQRFPFSINEDGELVSTAHIFKPIDDEKHLQYLREVVKVRDRVRTDKTLTELTVEFWRNDLIESIENLEVGPNEDFRDIPDAEEEITPLTVSYLTVVVKPPTIAEKRQRSPIKTNRQTITTQAFFNGVPTDQTFVLQKSDELRKKYQRIQRSQYVEDKSNDGKIKFVPAYEDKLALYDEAIIETHGFAHGIAAARFKLLVIDQLFESSVVDAKK